ncbi:hypothetical protein NE237_025968 [Protea cynaroides]|uniref:Uncharacterized protein n=1 Tax=Protea cynaroides TaxID=273540 RepID=A0A9Q0H799_9MAGN|nr:hypothetical protein NE237_025968 [Protea cynaroides]
MGKLLATAIAETFQASPLHWRNPTSATPLDSSKVSDRTEANTWDTVSGLEEQQKRQFAKGLTPLMLPLSVSATDLKACWSYKLCKSSNCWPRKKTVWVLM